jgi:hypothetical protein
MPIVPSVTMKASIRLGDEEPVDQPRDKSGGEGDGHADRMVGMPTPGWGAGRSCTMIIRPAMKAAIEPTDRSMPPDVMTKVMPTAMMPMKATAPARW